MSQEETHKRLEAINFLAQDVCRAIAGRRCASQGVIRPLVQQWTLPTGKRLR
jgi:hypothetical protein